VIGNTAKIEAVRAAAGLLMDKKHEYGSVGRWLGSLVGFEQQQRALRELRFIGPFGAYYVLSVAGFDVPEYEKWQEAYSPAARTG
jgi:3-methyladenine DNA glycosylase Tag